MSSTNPLQFLKNKTKDVVASGFNQLPDRGNLFLRYMTGFGGRNLDLDDKTINSIRESTVSLPKEAFKEEFLGSVGMVKRQQPGPWDIKPRSGPVSTYGFGYGPEVSQTLGRFNASVNPDETNINVTDTYDMENEFEDSDLVSGKFQPFKALNAVKMALKHRDPQQAGRSLMYILPTKPTPFNIDIDIPYSGSINNREVYN